jgi:eukaryotic-like serine/threonine-protein kinase
MVNEYSARPAGRLPWAIAALLGAALVVTAIPAVRHMREQAPPGPLPFRATWTAPPNLVIGSGADYPFGLSVSPDARQLAFAAARDGHVQLHLQDLSRGTLRVIAGTDRAALPFWSGDGGHVAFFADGALKAVDVATGHVAELARVATPRGGAWSASGDLVFTNDEGGLSRVSAMATPVAGPAPLTALDRAAGEMAHLFPAFVAGERHLIVFVRAADAVRQGLYLVSLADGTKTRLIGAAASGLAVNDRVIYANDGALVAQRLDLVEARLVGPAVVLGARVGQSPLGQLLASASGDTLVFSEPIPSQQELTWVSRDGERLGTVGTPADFWSLRIAPDGRRIAVTVLEPLLRTLDIVQYDGTSLIPSRLSLSIDADEWPAWSPDGLRVAWVQAGRAVMVRGAGAVLPAETITRFDEPVRVTAWTPDGHDVLVSRTMADTREDLWLVPVRGKGSPRALVATPFADVQGDISPDGRWVAYASDETGTFEIYVEPVQDRSPGPGTRERVSSGGGSDPRWSRDGQELFFRRGSEIHAATPASGRGQNAVAATSMVFKTEVPVRSFDVAPDGRRFLLSLPVAPPAQPATVIVHWTGTPDAPR